MNAYRQNAIYQPKKKILNHKLKKSNAEVWILLPVDTTFALLFLDYFRLNYFNSNSVLESILKIWSYYIIIFALMEYAYNYHLMKCNQESYVIYKDQI